VCVVAGVEDLNEEDVTETESPAINTNITAPFGYKVSTLLNVVVVLLLYYSLDLRFLKNL
jgi:hypothetical protein